MKIDSQTLENFRKGDLESLFLEIYPSLLRYATRVLGDNHAQLAEDCIQDAVYKVYLKRKRFNHPFELKAFLYTAVHNQMVDICRKHHLQVNYAKSIEWVENSPVDSFLLQETLDLLYHAINKLPDDLKKIYELAFEQHKKGAEIAQELNLSTSTVARQKSRLIEVLRKQFKDNGLMQLVISWLLTQL